MAHSTVDLHTTSQAREIIDQLGGAALVFLSREMTAYLSTGNQEAYSALWRNICHPDRGCSVSHSNDPWKYPCVLVLCSSMYGTDPQQ